MATPTVPLSPSVTLLAGPQLLGFMFAWALQGVLCVQVYIYHLYFPQDRHYIKLLVFGLFVWEWVQLGLMTQAAFDFDVYHFGDVKNLTEFHGTWFSVPVMTSVTACVVQLYYSRRIWILSSSKILAGGISSLSVAQMVLGIAGGVTIRVDAANAIARNFQERPLLVTSIIIALVVDVVIAAVNTHLLLRSKSEITKQSHDIVNRLVRLGIETGAVTATVAFIYVILFMMNADNLLFECPSLVLPKLYSNTLVVSLNNRAFVRDELNKSIFLNSLPNMNHRPTLSSGSVKTASVLRFSRGEPHSPCTELHIEVEVAEDMCATRDSGVPQKASPTALEPVPEGDEESERASACMV